MQDELRITFFVIGIVFIAGILLHGAWTIRKNKRQSRPNSFQSSKAYEPRFDQRETLEDDDDDDIYDDVGVGQARVISSAHLPIVEDEKLERMHNQHADRDTPILGDEEALLQPAEPVRPLIVDDMVDAPLSEGETIQTSPVPSHVNESEQEQKQEQELPSIKSGTSAPMYSGVVTQPKPEFSKSTRGTDNSDLDAIIPEPPEFLLRKSNSSANPEAAQSQAEAGNKGSESAASTNIDEASAGKPVSPVAKAEAEPDFSLNVQDGPIKSEQASEQKAESEPAKATGVEKELSFAEQAKRFVTRRKKTVGEKIRKEPKVPAKGNSNDEQMRIDFESANTSDSQASEPSATTQTNTAQTGSDSNKQSAPESDVLVLNVRAGADNPISGAALLPMLLTLGFKFGEHDIFHRHVNTNGKGPILFSLTNMFKPGVFDIDNIENFSTQGVSLFMMLPIEGEAQQVFNMMHNAARKIAEEFDCKILDGNKVLISKQSLQHYSERIREFERSRHAR